MHYPTTNRSLHGPSTSYTKVCPAISMIKYSLTIQRSGCWVCWQNIYIHCSIQKCMCSYIHMYITLFCWIQDFKLHNIYSVQIKVLYKYLVFILHDIKSEYTTEIQILMCKLVWNVKQYHFPQISLFEHLCPWIQ